MGADHQIFETTALSRSLSRTHLPPSFIICLITSGGRVSGELPPKAISAASSPSAKTQLKFKMICSERSAAISAGRISMHLLHYVGQSDSDPPSPHYYHPPTPLVLSALYSQLRVEVDLSTNSPLLYDK